MTKMKFPLINEVGLIITKADSVKLPKRKRDFFDIYLAIKQARSYDQFVSIFQRIKKENGDLFNVLYGIKEALDKHGIVSNILDYAYPTTSEKAMEAEKTKQDILKFLADVQLPRKAKHSY